MPSPPPIPDPTLLGQVRRVLFEAEFTETRIRALLGACDPGTPADDLLPQWLWRCRGGDPLAVLVRLFMLGTRVGYREVSRALAPMTVEQWEHLGLLRHDRTRVFANVELTAKPGFVIAYDPEFASSRPTRYHVLSVTQSALTVNRCTIRREALRSLDLGAGNGFLALHMSAHSDSVTAVDLNPRALAFARFNAVLNDVLNVEFRESDRYSAVAGESFDLIAGNLPFVISPASELLYRDGEGGSRGFLRSVLRDAPAHLNEGGFAQFLGQWTGGDAPEIPGCDVCILRFTSDSADEHAARWLLPGAIQGRGTRARLYREWMKFYEQEHIDVIHTGLWTLRRRSGTGHWRVMLDRPMPVVTWGDRLEESFRSWGCWQALCGGPERLAQRVRLSPFTVLRTESQWEPWRAESLLLSSDGFGVPTPVREAALRWIPLADGTRTLCEIAAELQLADVEAWLEEVAKLLLHGHLELA